MGLPGWRVVKALAESEAKTSGVVTARTCVAELRALLNEGTAVSQWQAWSWRSQREAVAMCEALDMPGQEANARAAWHRVLRTTYRPDRGK